MSELEKAAREFQEKKYSIWTGKGMAGDLHCTFIAGAQWQSKQSPWVSVEEGYPVFDPDDHKRYIVKVEFGSMIKDRQTAVTWMANKFKFAIEMDWVTVTHWMEIPE